MILEQSEHVIQEVKKAFMGKDDIIRRVLATIYAGGHILLEDCPGVGKTTLALAFSKVLGLDYRRIQFTTDTLPSDITGLPCITARMSSLNTMKALLCATFCWQTRSTVLHLKHSLPFWKPWKSGE